MDEIKTEPQKIFEDLTKEEQKLLRKEFGENVETRFKVFLWSGIVLLLPILVCGGFSVYYMINIFSTNSVPFQFYICVVIFTVGGTISMLLSSQYHKRFRIWLKENKKIDTRANTPNK